MFESASAFHMPDVAQQGFGIVVALCGRGLNRPSLNSHTFFNVVT